MLRQHGILLIAPDPNLTFLSSSSQPCDACQAIPEPPPDPLTHIPHTHRDRSVIAALECGHWSWDYSNKIVKNAHPSFSEPKVTYCIFSSGQLLKSPKQKPQKSIYCQRWRRRKAQILTFKKLELIGLRQAWDDYFVKMQRSMNQSLVGRKLLG